MKKIINLTKIYLKLNKTETNTSFNPTMMTNDQFRTLMNLIVGVIIMIITFTFGKNISGMGAILCAVVIKALFGIFSIMFMLMQIGKVISTFYLDSDIETMMVLPYRPAEIVFAKFVCVLVPCYATIIAIMMPLLAGIGFGIGAGVSYWMYLVITMILFPIAPLAYSGLIAIIIMRLFKGIRNKNLISMIGVIVPIVFMILYVILNTTVFKDKNAVDIGTMMAAQAGVINVINNVFPSSLLLGNALINNSVISLILGFGVIVITFAILMMAACKWYFTGVLQMRNGSSNNKSMNHEEIVKMMKKRSQKNALIIKDLGTLLRTPTHMMQAILVPFIFMLIIIISSLGVINGSEEAFSLEKCISNAFMFGIMFSVFFGMASTVAITSFSREGNDLSLLRQLPVPNNIIYKAKRDISIIVAIAQTIPGALVIIIAMMLKGGVSIASVVPVVAIIIWNILFMSSFNTFIGSINPIVNWQTENIIYASVIMTRLPSGFLSMIIDLVMLLIFDVVAGCVNIYFSLVLVIILMVLFYVVINKVFMNLCVKKINRM